MIEVIRQICMTHPSITPFVISLYIYMMNLLVHNTTIITIQEYWLE